MKKHKALQKAMKKYPKGSVLKNIRVGTLFTSSGIFKIGTHKLDCGLKSINVYDAESDHFVMMQLNELEYQWAERED